MGVIKNIITIQNRIYDLKFRSNIHGQQKPRSGESTNRRIGRESNDKAVSLSAGASAHGGLQIAPKRFGSSEDT